MGQYRIREEWKDMTWKLLNEAGRKHPRNCQKIRLSAIIFFPKNVRRDPSNYTAPLYKGILDQLVAMNVIPDDSSEHVECAEPKLLAGKTAETILSIEVLNG